MKIIISPAKKMVCDDSLNYQSLPVLLSKSQQLYKDLKEKDYQTLKTIWKCNDAITQENIDRIETMNLYGNLSPAILSYSGIQYQYMAPNVFENNQFDYIQKHLRILSGFYGILKPMDGVTPYRLEMGAKYSIDGYKDLYAFWNQSIYDALNDSVILNLASNEYSKIVSKYLKEDDRMITCFFGEMVNDKFKVKGTYAKMARGEMVRFMAINDIEDLEDIKAFNELGYHYCDDLSDDNNFYFVRENND